MMRAEINTSVRQWWEATAATEHPSPHSRQAGVTRPGFQHKRAARAQPVADAGLAEKVRAARGDLVLVQKTRQHTR